MENPGTGKTPEDGYDWTMHKIAGIIYVTIIGYQDTNIRFQ